MTDATTSPPIREQVERRLAKRYRAERRFRAYGLAAILLALSALGILVGSIIFQAAPAFTAFTLNTQVELPAERAAPGAENAEPGSDEWRAAVRAGSFREILQESLQAEFPQLEDRDQLRALFGLYAGVNATDLMNRVLDEPRLINRRVEHSWPLSDDADRYLKGLATPRTRIRDAEAAQIVSEDPLRLTLDGALSETIEDRLGADRFTFSPDSPSLLLLTRGGAVRITAYDSGAAEGETLLPLEGESATADLLILETPQRNRQVQDIQAALIEYLADRDVIRQGFNDYLFTRTDSREPELAGVLGAMIGSVLTMMVTMLLAVPIGVFTAIYLEEYAPKNRWSNIIEVNINNLAAVPSIVFGLLGLAVFINMFGLPRSAPLVGGMVLALMTLPTVIISSRAALKAVPPSIRQAAMGLGASRTQTVFDHVLPLAMPGILTGSIIGLAQALGETAPLLMIGMVAFVADTPSGPTDPSTVMPVQIFMWVLNPERAWEARSAAAIIVLLTLMILMNTLAVFLRRRFEKRW